MGNIESFSVQTVSPIRSYMTPLFVRGQPRILISNNIKRDL